MNGFVSTLISMSGGATVFCSEAARKAQRFADIYVLHMARGAA